MYATLSRRNAKISFRNYAIYFITLVLAIGLFYVFLALPEQDVMRFLHRYEGRAVATLTQALKYLSVFVLLGLFFLVRYANSFMLERRRREIGMYLVLGMHQSKVFRILFIESIILGAGAWVVGIALGVILSELLSLFTIRVFELNVLTHYFRISGTAVWQTALAFFIVQIAVNLFQSTKVFRYTPEQWMIGKNSSGELENKTLRKIEHLGAKGKSWLFPLSILMIGGGYILGIKFADLMWVPEMWNKQALLAAVFAVALILGSAGTLLLFYSLGHFLSNMNRIAPHWYYKRLHSFSTREFTRQLGMRSISVGLVCLLLFLSILLFSFGVLTAQSGRGMSGATSGKSGRPIDMTVFYDHENHVDEFVDALADDHLVGHRFDVHTAMVTIEKDSPEDGYSSDTEDGGNYVPMDLDAMVKAVRQQAGGQEEFKDLLELLEQTEGYMSMYLINGADYNRSLTLRGEEPIDFNRYDVAIYSAFLSNYADRMKNPEMLDEFRGFIGGQTITIDGTDYLFAPILTDEPFVSDYAVTYSLALIVNEPLFEQYARNEISTYTNILFPEERLAKEGRISLTEDALQIADKFTEKYGSEAVNPEGEKIIVPPFSINHQMQVMSRKMITIVAVCYTFIYLGVIFTIMAASILALQQMTSIRDRGKQYTLLARIGARENEIKKSVALQTSFYFGAPLIIALIHTSVGTVMLHRMMAGSVPIKQWGDIFITMGILVALYLIYYVYTVISSQKYLSKVKLTEQREAD